MTIEPSTPMDDDGLLPRRMTEQDWVQTRKQLPEYYCDPGGDPLRMPATDPDRDPQVELFGRYRTQKATLRYADGGIIGEVSYKIWPWVMFSGDRPIAILWLQAHGIPAKKDEDFIADQLQCATLVRCMKESDLLFSIGAISLLPEAVRSQIKS